MSEVRARLSDGKILSFEVFHGDPRTAARCSPRPAVMSVDTPGGEIGCGDRDPLLVGDPGFVEEDSPLPDRVDYDPDYDPARPIECERCGGQMFYVGGCKILCGNCGYRRDCSDP